LNRRAPRGARGLKLRRAVGITYPKASRPARGAWIETHQSEPPVAAAQVAPRAGRVD